MLDGKPVIGPGADRGVVFQKHALMPWLNVVDNVEFGLRMRGVPPAERRRVALEKLRLVGLAGLSPSARSTSCRAACSSASASRARSPPTRQLMLMDEPLGALDAFTRESIQELILDVWHRTGKMMFFITHSVEEALFLATHLIVMTPGPGRISHEYRLDFGRRFIESRDARAVKSSTGLHPRARGSARGHPASRPRGRRMRVARGASRMTPPRHAPTPHAPRR